MSYPPPPEEPQRPAGSSQLPFGHPPPPAERSTKALIALVSGILNLVLCGGVISLVPIICGHLALGDIKNSGGEREGRGFALAGLIMGYVGLIVLVVTIFIAIAFFAALEGGVTDYTNT